MSFFLKKKLEMAAWSFFSKLDWGSYIVSVPKLAATKTEALIRFMKFLYSEVALYPYKSTILS